VPDTATKRCCHCQGWYPLDAFGRNRSTPDGLNAMCRECARESCRRSREANREKVRELDRERYRADPEAARERAREYREANRDAIRERERERAREQPDGSCAVDGCGGTRRGGDFCGMHYARWKRTGDPGPAAKINLPCPDECTVDGCTTDVRAKGLCATHYARWQKHGDPLAGAFQPRGTCQVDGCGRRHAAGGYCSTHYGNFRVHGTPEAPVRDPGYQGAHYKVYRMRGAARDNDCLHCGARARHWAYDHGDPDERRDPRRGGPYSLDPAHYIPLCASCHTIMDQAAEKKEPA